ncbi:hypothetical protein DF185_15640 [Marinifilum breve]|uniref:Uncharacterized protein n=1 Tax=Marinifilum breve TaxID=2184082 RepID=A0A2V3ZYH2_9BACT|nr:hypothetical protein [Marinifilum breve]PXX98808.1 hypothetical protein DF185_15640 [Marinifilum breve]
MTTPKDFLERLKIHFRYEPVIEGSVRSDEFSKLTRVEIQNFESSIKEKYKNYKVEDDHLVTDLFNDVLSILTPTERDSLTNVAFGKIYNTKMNAFCAKSQDGLDNYCIVINEGLLMLLHKYGKLAVARENPENVSFCNRGKTSDFTSETYESWANELINNYKYYKAPVGAMLKLKPEGTAQHAFSLHFQELFVLCHELGHFLNKDLENKENLTYLIASEAEVIEENKYHQIEFNADLYAFDLVSRVAKHKYNINSKYILPFIIILFDTMAMINPNQGKKHPGAINRIMNIVENHWGKDIADEYLKTYEDVTTINDFFNKI